jgi:hypothetical protein
MPCRMTCPVTYIAQALPNSAVYSVEARPHTASGDDGHLAKAAVQAVGHLDLLIDVGCHRTGREHESERHARST